MRFSRLESGRNPARKPNFRPGSTYCVINIEYEDWQYIVHTWVPAKKGEVPEESEKVVKGSRFAISAAESQEAFSRHL